MVVGVICGVLMVIFVVHGQITSDNLVKCPESCDEICPNGVSSCKKVVTTSQDLKMVTMTFHCLNDDGTAFVEPETHDYTNPEVGTNFGTKCSTYNTIRSYNFDGGLSEVNIKISGN